MLAGVVLLLSAATAIATPVANLPLNPFPRQVDMASSIPSQCKSECTSLVSLYNDCLTDLTKCMSLCEKDNYNSAVGCVNCSLKYTTVSQSEVDQTMAALDAVCNGAPEGADTVNPVGGSNIAAADPASPSPASPSPASPSPPSPAPANPSAPAPANPSAPAPANPLAPAGATPSIADPAPASPAAASKAYLSAPISVAAVLGVAVAAALL